MRPQRHKALVDKAISACLAGIEIYNKPSFPHREEAFAILMASSWELALKARVVKENGNRMAAIYQTEPLRKKNGKPSKRTRVVENEAGNPMTIGLSRAMHLVSQMPEKKLAPACADNIRSLQAIRDNAIHFIAEDRALAETVWQVGTGALRNFMAAVQDWFGYDLTTHRLFMMPLAFVQPTSITAVPIASRSKELANLNGYLEQMDARNPGVGSEADYVVSLRLDIKIVGSRHADAPAVRLTNDLAAPTMRLSEDEWRKTYSLNFAALTKAMRKRYSDFSTNPRFYKIKKQLEADPRLAHHRRFDPYNPRSQEKIFYAPAILDAFDKHYTRRTVVAPDLKAAAE